jgi:hypothetical protein
MEFYDTECTYDYALHTLEHSTTDGPGRKRQLHDGRHLG